VPAVLDIATSSGHHLEGLKSALDEVYVPKGLLPKAVLLEKPVVSPDEMGGLEALLARHGIEDSIIVNETYLASSALAKVSKLAEEKRKQGITVSRVEVVKYKDRVPDVKAGRFTDPELGAFGIEMPHMVSIACVLAGMQPEERLVPTQNVYYQGIDGIRESEATYVTARTESGVEIAMAQGLGPFTMDAEGGMVRYGGLDEGNNMPDIVRNTVVRFSDGTSARIDFDPAPGVPRYHSILRTFDARGKQLKEEVIADNMLKRIIEGTADLAKTGVRPDVARALDVRTAMRTVLTLAALRGATELQQDVAIAGQ
jgi:predicted dehydrogenase